MQHKKIIVFTLLALLPIFMIGQRPNNLKEILELYKQNQINQKKIDKILKADPELKFLLDAYVVKNGKQKNISITKPLFSADYFKHEAERIKKIMSDENLKKIKELFYEIHNSEYAKDISYIVLHQMEIVKQELEESIENLPNKRKQ